MLDTFDVVIQITRQKLLTLILQNVRVAKLSPVPKWQIGLSGPTGNFNAIFDSVDLTLEVGTNHATLAFHIYAASIVVPNENPVGITDGEMDVKLDIVPGFPFKVILQSAELKTSQTGSIKNVQAFFLNLKNLLTGHLDTQTGWDLFDPNNTPDNVKLLMMGLTLNGKIQVVDADTVAGMIGSGQATNVTNFINPHDIGVGMSANWTINNVIARPWSGCWIRKQLSIICRG
jgi:hypothetical protein